MFKRIALGLQLLSLAVTSAFAQEAGQIVGSIRDQSGALIPQATVTVTEAGTSLGDGHGGLRNQRAALVTNGAYNLSRLLREGVGHRQAQQLKSERNPFEHRILLKACYPVATRTPACGESLRAGEPVTTLTAA